PKPPRPVNITTEWIAFSALEDMDPDLLGSAEVEGCCPNAGPYPLFVMTLPHDLGDSEEGPHIPAGTYEGELFINGFGAGRDRQYIVQFWFNQDVNFVIVGGDIDYNKKTKVLTVIFTQEECRFIGGGCAECGEFIAYVNFKLVRYPL
ncbi:MAG: hypothetical protein OQK55_06715, partial [Thermoanaerobaculales bacterium]|nr:hypothetical protein [Thermoanaerobaculales bacterium]